MVWHKKFGPAQNILGPVKGQGISEQKFRSKHSSNTVMKQTLVESRDGTLPHCSFENLKPVDNQKFISASFEHLKKCINFRN